MAAGDGSAAVGGGLGGVPGNVVGGQLGGSTGAAVGAGVGGAAGSAVGANKHNRTWKPPLAVVSALPAARWPATARAAPPVRPLVPAWAAQRGVRWATTWATTAVELIPVVVTSTTSTNTKTAITD